MLSKQYFFFSFVFHFFKICHCLHLEMRNEEHYYCMYGYQSNKTELSDFKNLTIFHVCKVADYHQNMIPVP